MAEFASDELAGAVAIVTGAAGGVGRATVVLLRSRGACVVAEDIDPAVEALEDERVATLQGDVAEAGTARQAVALARERFGALDVLVNNAGRFPGCASPRSSIVTGAILMADGGFSAQ